MNIYLNVFEVSSHDKPYALDYGLSNQNLVIPVIVKNDARFELPARMIMMMQINHVDLQNVARI